MILRYLRYSFFFSIAAKFLRTETVKCPARAVIAKSGARHVHVMSQVVKVHLFNLGLPMNRYTFVLPSENRNAFACSPCAQMPFSHSRTSRRSVFFS